MRGGQHLCKLSGVDGLESLLVTWPTQRNTIGYPRFYSRSHGTVIRVCDDADNVMEAHVQAGDFKAFKLKGDGECSRQHSEV